MRHKNESEETAKYGLEITFKVHMTWKISHFKKTKCLSVKVELFLYTQLTEDVKVHITRKVSHFRNTLIQKAFQYRVQWCYSLCDMFFFVPGILKFSYYANLVTDDVIGCASTFVRHKIQNISANNEAMLLQLGRNVEPYEIYQMVPILMLL